MSVRTPLLVALLALALAGCTAYRVESNVSTPVAGALPDNTPVLITSDALPERKYEEVGPVSISIKKMSIFHANPTREQANKALSEKARAIGADAVINVTYRGGIGLTSWGYLDAKGMGVKLVN